MPQNHWLRNLVARCCFALAISLLGLASASATTTALSIHSAKGNYLSGGSNLYYTPADGTFSPQVGSDGTVTVAFSNGPTFWSVAFFAGANVPLTTGTYTIDPQNSGASVPRLAVDSNSAISGKFTVREIAFGPNNTLAAFRAEFVMRSTWVPGFNIPRTPIEGEVLYNAGSAAPSRVSPVGPLHAVAFVGTPWSYQFNFGGTAANLVFSDLPPGLQANAAGLIYGTPHAAGTYFARAESTQADGVAVAMLVIDVKEFAQSSGAYTAMRTIDEPFEILGQGRNEFFRSDYDPIELTGNTQRVVVRNHPDGFYETPYYEITLTPPAGSSLAVGSYDNVTPYAANQPPGSGLSMSVTANSTSCRDSVGSYEIREIEFNSAGAAVRIHFTFSVRCTASDTPLRGEVWVNSLTAVTSARDIIGTIGQPVSYNVVANNQPTSFTAQNLPPGMAIDSQTGAISGVPSTAGTFDVQVAAQGPNSTATATVRFTVASGVSLLNLSTRGVVGTGENVLIGGFIVSGANSKSLVFRGIGPSLSTAGVNGVLPDPKLSVQIQQGKTGTIQGFSAQDDWQDGNSTTYEERPRIEQWGLAPQHAFESSTRVKVTPGQYTVTLSGVNNSTGNGLVEIYDVSSNENSFVANLSTRGFVGTGDDVMIGGFIVSGPAASTCAVGIRALGPSLTALGVANALADPVLDVFDRNGNRVAGNDDWQSDQAAEIREDGLNPGSPREAVLITSFPVGNYTATIRSKDNSSGVGLIEVYRLQ